MADSSRIILVDRIEPLIRTIRGQNVMLDSDLAALYGVTTKRFNEQVRRNQERFPGDFMFQLTAQEATALRSQNATLKRGRLVERSKDVDDEFAEDVRIHGWSVANINDHKPPFQYTIGLMQTCRHPEFIVFGLDSDNAHALFSGLVRDLRAGRSYAQPGVYTINLGSDEHRVGFRRVHPTQHPLYLGFAMGFLTNIGRIGELEAMQAFWPDSSGKFPFEAGCDLAVYELQPRLDLGLTPREVRRFERQWE
jgi:hypothetical protein